MALIRAQLEAMNEPLWESPLRAPEEYILAISPVAWADVVSVTVYFDEAVRSEDGSCPNDRYGVTLRFKDSGSVRMFGTGYNDNGAKNADNVVKALWAQATQKDRLVLCGNDEAGYAIRSRDDPKAAPWLQKKE